MTSNNLYGLVRVDGNAISDPALLKLLNEKRDALLARENIPHKIIHEDMGYNHDAKYSWMNVTYMPKDA